MKFYDVKAKKSFTIDKFRKQTKIVKGKKREFAVATSPLTGIECWRVL